MTVECSCGCTFISFDGADACPACNESRDPLRCVECATELREAVPDGLCGLCAWTPSTYDRALMAMAGDLS